MFNKIDRSKNDELVRWASMCETELGPSEIVCMKFQDNSQGLDRLDKYWGALLGIKATKHPLLGAKVNTYVEACNRHNRARADGSYML